MYKENQSTMADPGFPRAGDANSPRGAPIHDYAKFTQKLHEIERILTRGGGGGARDAPPLDPPLIKMFLHRNISLEDPILYKGNMQ